MLGWRVCRAWACLSFGIYSLTVSFPQDLLSKALWYNTKLQTLVYDILPSTTAVFSYATGSRKLSANEQFFVGSQTVVSLLQTTQIISDVCFITDHVPYASSNKTQIASIETKLFFFTRGGRASCLRACLGARLLPQSYQYSNLSEGADRVGGQPHEDKEYPSVTQLNLAEFGGRCRKGMLGVWYNTYSN